MENDMPHSLLRRTSFIVEDVEVSARFYQDIFGWTIFYDQGTPVDKRFPPCAPDQTIGKIIILKVDDPYIGMIGFMEYQGFTPEKHVQKDRDSLGLGDAILVVETKDIQATHNNACQAQAKMVTAPIEWSVTDHSGKGEIRLATFSFFDPNGIYVEVNSRL